MVNVTQCSAAAAAPSERAGNCSSSRRPGDTCTQQLAIHINTIQHTINHTVMQF